MLYNPDFSRNEKGQFKLDNAYVAVKAGSEAYLLEDELNEMQWIQNEQRAQSIRSLYSSGIPYDTLKFTENEHPDDETICFKGYGNTDLENNAMMFNIQNYIPIIFNGYIIKLQGTYHKDLTGKNTDNNNILIKLPDEPTDVERYDLMYLEMWFEELDIKTNNDIKLNGGELNDSIGTFKADDRMQDAETTRRIQMKWDIRVVENAQHITDETVRPRGNSDYENYVPATSLNDKSYSKDKNLFVSVTNPGIINGTFYAMPIMSMYRLIGNTQMSIQNTITQIVTSTTNITKIPGDLTISGTGDNVTNIKIVNNNGNASFVDDNDEYITVEAKDYILHDNSSEEHNITLHNENAEFEVLSALPGQDYANTKLNHLTSLAGIDSGKQINIKGTEKVKMKWQSGNSDLTNKLVVANNSGDEIATFGYENSNWIVNDNKILAIDENGVGMDSNGNRMLADKSLLNKNKNFKTLTGNDQYELNADIDQKVYDLEKDTNKVKFWTQTTDPGSKAKENDIWIDLNYFIFKIRTNNKWQPMRASYDA